MEFFTFGTFKLNKTYLNIQIPKKIL